MPEKNFGNDFTTDYNNPCYCCVPPERHLGCHDRCEKRLKWLEILEARKKHLKEYLDSNSVSIEGQQRVAKSIKSDGLVYGTKWRNKK